MAKKKRVGRSKQHSKGNKSARPRSWHHGAAQGHVDEGKLLRATPAFDKAAADQEAVKERTRTHRAATGDWNDALAQLDRSAPYVPSWDFAL